MGGVTNEGIKLLSQALDNFERLQIPEKEAEVLYFQTLVYKRLRKFDSAQDRWTKALEALDRANPETTRGMRNLIERSRPQQPAARQPRTRESRQARRKRRRQG